MQVSFHKYQGAGNDFILIDSRETEVVQDAGIIRRMCDRRFGIGADGLMVYEPSNESGLDFYMRYYNSDGNPGSLCGNGGRCIVRHAFLTDSTNVSSVRFMASDGIHCASILPDGRISLEMLDVNAVESTDWGYYVNTGSPHLVKVTTELNRLNVVEHGRHLRNTWPEQPGGTNVNFMEKDANGLHVRTYERGVEDETLSCGTGVTACALVAYFLGWLPEAQATIQTRGGTLDVSFLPNTHGYSQVRLIGPAEKVFQGTIIL